MGSAIQAILKATEEPARLQLELRQRLDALETEYQNRRNALEAEFKPRIERAMLRAEAALREMGIDPDRLADASLMKGQSSNFPGDETSKEIVDLLATGPKSLAELAQATLGDDSRASRQKISSRLFTLSKHNLVEAIDPGTRHVKYRIADAKPSSPSLLMEQEEDMKPPP